MGSIRVVGGTPLEQLDGSLANLHRVKFSVIRGALSGSRGAEVRRRVIEGMLDRASRGTGIRITIGGLLAPFAQTGLECQTLTLLNGIQFVGCEAVARELVGRIEELRAEAERFAAVNSTDSAYDMVAVSEVLRERGFLRHHIDIVQNPIQITEALFAPKRFLGISSKSRWHAFAIIPLEHPEADRFVLSVDSMGGRMQHLSVDQFFDLLLELSEEPGSRYCLYEAVHLPDRTPPFKPPSRSVLAALVGWILGRNR